MGGKKKGKKGKKAKKASSEEEEKNEVDMSSALMMLPEFQPRMVTLKFCLINWQYSQFSLTVPVTTRMFKIHKELVKYHGRIESLKICLHQFAEENVITDELATLESLGIEGTQRLDPSDEVMEVIMYYDFVPANYDDPILSYHP